MTKIYAISESDESVGIFPVEVEIKVNVPISAFNDKDDREAVRCNVSELIELLSGDRARRVYFEDEIGLLL